MKSIYKTIPFDLWEFILNQEKNIIIIGCGAGGGTAAQFARKTDRKANITIFEKGKYPQYSKCALPYAISKKIPEFNNLIEFSEEWFKKSKINLFLETIVEKIDIENKKIIAKNNKETIVKDYDSLIIATGAQPFIPSIKNIIENDTLISGIHVLRTIDDAKNIASNIKNAKNVTIIGAGLIGLEMADNLKKLGMNVSVIEMFPQILPNVIDSDLSKIIYDEMSKYTTIYLDFLATEIHQENGKIRKALIKNNKTDEIKEIETDLLIISTGNKPDTLLGRDIGCNLNEKGFIKVNEKSETSVDDVYAVGDCTEFIDFVTKKPASVGLGSIAVRQAIAAGINSAGGEFILPSGVLKTCTSEFFNIEIASVGICKSEDIKLVSGKFNGSSLPEYFPGGKPITIKVYADTSGKIVGAQAVGDKAAQRINIFACAILGGMSIDTFRKLETAYAPPVAPTIDAVTLVCDIVSMKLNRKR